MDEEHKADSPNDSGKETTHAIKEVWPWGVDTYQVPVRKGDYTIPFLVKRQDANTATIIKAILIDGGKPAAKCCEALDQTISKITQRYQGTFPGFSYWLITHWDDDHYLGALQNFRTEGRKDNNFCVYGPVKVEDGLCSNAAKDARDYITQNFHQKTFKDCFGVDFFNDATCELKQAVENMTFAEWVKGAGTKEKPMFLCIGANRRCFNGGSCRFGATNEPNETSAFFVITWRDSSQVCYHAAGDGNMEIEKHFHNKGTFRSAKHHTPFVLVAKATHHGAIKEFNDGFFEDMLPMHYVVSAGKQYGHPTAALLIKLARISFKSNKSITMWTSRYPYWLYEDNTIMNAELDKKDEMEITLEQLDEDHDVEKARKKLKELWEKLSNSSVPKSDKGEKQDYRIDMHFYYDGKAGTTVKVRARDPTEEANFDQDEPKPLPPSNL